MDEQLPNADEIWDAWTSARTERPGLTQIEFAQRYGDGGATVLETLDTLLHLEESEPPPPLVDVGPGAVFAGFRLVTTIGEGSAGIVFEAIDERVPGSEKRVALKALNPLVTVGAERRETILREAQVASRLEHEGIVRVLDSGVERGYTWIASEFVDGLPLAKWIGAVKGDEAAAAAVDMGLQIARALEHAHGRGVVHRDLKPANIVRTPRGRVRLLDFGLARVEAAAFTVSRSGSAVGTPLYMAPEQLRGERSVGPPADLYALGLIMLEVARGQRLTTHGQALETLARIARGKFRLPTRFLRGIPGALRAVVSRCLEPVAEDRYASAVDLIADLEAARDGLRLPTGRLGQVRRTWRRMVRHKARASAAVVAVMLVGWIASRLVPGPEWEPLHPVREGYSDRDGFGVSLAGGADFDGDGVFDYAVAAPEFDPPEVGKDAGAVWVFSGSDGRGLAVVHGESPGDKLGHVEFMPDINDDGRAELVVSATQDTDGHSRRGYVRVLSYESPDPLPMLRGTADDDHFGCDIHAGGDVDGDGVTDLIVGAQQYWGSAVGYVRVFSGDDGSVIHDISGTDAPGLFGTSVCIVGDLDGDGRAEFAVGARNAASKAGRVYVFDGETGVWIELEGPAGLFGASLRPIEDMDGDGRKDLVVGAPTARQSDGVVQCFSAWTGKPIGVSTRGRKRAGLGRSVAGLGDVDGDGVPDFAAGTGQGEYVVVVSGADGTELLQFDGETRPSTVAATGDIDGDLLRDLLVGFPRSSAGDVSGRGIVRIFATRDRPKNSDAP